MPPPPLAFHLAPDDGRGGRRFCLYHPPRGPVLRGGLSYIAPFGEEMNKSRRMAAVQARALAGAGYAVLQMDLLGSGDSSGDFGDASWADWMADVEFGLRWLRARLAAAASPVATSAADAGPPPVWLWGLRAGCLLAAEVARRAAQPPNLLFWQPAASGKAVLQQFLRLRLAGDALAGRAQGAMEALKRELAAGRAVEIAGYRLAPALASGLAAATLEPPAATQIETSIAGRIAPVAGQRLAWLELSLQPGTGLSLPAAGLLARWGEAGWASGGRVVPGPAFWQTSEIELAPALPGASLAMLEEAAGPVLYIATAAPVVASPEVPPAAGSAGDAVETALVFDCAGDALVGVLAPPAGAAAGAGTGVLILVGGPQYRAGSHRQFVSLSRALAGAGFATLRFDRRGMGDSGGEPRGFEHLGDDIAAALRTLHAQVPGLTRVVLWGLCDGASAALLGLPPAHAGSEPGRIDGIGGLALVNPWVRTDVGQARTALRHYYPQRLRQADFWVKLLRGRVARGALAGALRSARRGFSADAGEGMAVATSSLHPATHASANPADYTRRMAAAWRRFPGPVLLLLSGRDHTAQEFIDHQQRDPAWAGLVQRPGVERHDLPDADHTLSAAADEARATALTIAWLRRLPQPATDSRRAAGDGG